MIRKFFRSFTYLLSLVILVGTIGAGSYYRLLENYELAVLDWRFRLRPNIQVSDKVVFIDIDNDSIQKLGQFPVERASHARLIKALSKFGAKAVVFDIFFSEPRKGDLQLEEAIRLAGNVYLPFVFTIDKKPEKGYLSASAYSTENLKQLSKSAKGMGHINVLPDSDGKFRKIPLFIKYQEKLYPSLSFLVGCKYLGISLKDLTLKPGQTVQLGPHFEVPLDEDGNIIVNFTGKWQANFPHYSYQDVILSYNDISLNKKPQITPKIFKDKICLVGYTADGTTDLHPSPFEPLYPSIGMHAQVLNSMIYNNFIKRAPRSENLFILCLVLILILTASLKISPVMAFGILCVVNFILVAVGVILFNTQGLWIDLVYPITIISLVYFTCTLIRFSLEFKKRIILENELKIAKNIQESFLPSTVPYMEGVDIGVCMITARLVGGDLYDFLKFDDNTIGVMIGDVTGKGVPASLFMAMVSGSFKFYSKPTVSPEKTLSSLNEKIMQESSSNLFVTLAYSVFAIKEQIMSYANGGHVPVLYLPKNKKSFFLNVEDGLPLGMIEGTYAGNQIKFNQDDIFIFYTDGITEAVSDHAQMYGAERLVEIVENNRNLSAQRLCGVIKKDVIDFMPKNKQQDDITIIVVKIS